MKFSVRAFVLGPDYRSSGIKLFLWSHSYKSSVLNEKVKTNEIYCWKYDLSSRLFDVNTIRLDISNSISKFCQLAITRIDQPSNKFERWSRAYRGNTWLQTTIISFRWCLMMFNVCLMFVVKSKTVGFTMSSCEKMILYIVLKKKIVEV